MLVRFPCISAFSPSHVLRTLALIPLEEWRSEHVWLWLDALYAEHTDNKEKFSEFFNNLPKIANGSTLASYDKSDVEKRFKTDDGRAFAPVFGPELYARLQMLKGQGAFLPPSLLPSFPPSICLPICFEG